MKHRICLFFLLLIVLFSISIRLPYLNCPLESDEGGFAYQAYFFLKKDISFYDSCIFRYLPGFPLLYVLIFKIFGSRPSDIRLFIAIWNVFTIIFIYFTTKKITDEYAALFASFLYACFSWHPLIQGHIGKEIFMLLPLVLSLYFYLLYHNHFDKLPLFFAGFFVGLSVVFKQSTLPIWAHFLLFIYLESQNKLRHWLIFLLGACLPIFIFSSYACFSIGIKRFCNLFFVYQVGFASIFIGPWWYHLLRFTFTSTATGLCFLLIAVFYARRSIKNNMFLWYFLISYLFFSFIGVTLGGCWWRHYYLQLLPALTILLGWEGASLWRSKSKKIYIFIGLLILPFFFDFMAALYEHTHCIGIVNGLGQEISTYLKKNSKADDKIYAFLYLNPSIYFEAEREAALPYLWKTDLLFRPERIYEVIELIKSNNGPIYLITYSKENTLQYIHTRCEGGHNFIEKIKKSLLTYYPFCKGYPVQIELANEFFEIIPQFYSPIKNFDYKVTIWKKN